MIHNWNCFAVKLHIIHMNGICEVYIQVDKFFLFALFWQNWTHLFIILLNKDLDILPLPLEKISMCYLVHTLKRTPYQL